MFCPHCGKENENGVKFCGGCGKELIPAPKPTPAPTPAPAPKPQKPPKPQKEKKPKDNAKRQKALKKSILFSSLAFGLSFLISIGSLVFYFVSPAAALEDTAKKAPKALKVADPTYDLEFLTKPEAEALDTGEKATKAELSALSKSVASIKSAIKKGEKEAKKDEPKLNKDTISTYLYEVRQQIYELYRDDKIADYSSSSDGIVIELNSGILYSYFPFIDGYDAGTEAGLTISTYQPCLSSYDKDYDSYMKYPDSSAQKIVDTFPLYQFAEEGNFDSAEVSEEALNETTEFNIVLWHGHGGFTYKTGPAMVTGIAANDQNNAKLYSLLKDQSLVLGSENYLVTSNFFSDHLEDNALDNSLFYLGTCSSAASNDLADAILGKGAEAVFANSGTIHTKYNLKMMKSVVDGFCQKNAEGIYNTAAEALQYAKDTNGEYDTDDCRYTYVRLYGNESYSLDWYEDHMKADREVVLVLDGSGSMDGEPMNETVAAAKKFITTVMDAKATLSVVAYDDSAETLIGFSRREGALGAAIDRAYKGGGTNIDSGLSNAHELLKDKKSKKKIIVLMSDGIPNQGRTGESLYSFADEIREDDINIYTLGFFHKLSDNEKADAQEVLRRIADSGCYHDIADTDDVAFVFDDIATEISGERKIYLEIKAPASVEITHEGETLSPENPRTSFGSISVQDMRSEEEKAKEEEENSSYEEYSSYLPGSGSAQENESYENYESAENDSNLTKVVRLKEGLEYNVNIRSTGAGMMDFAIGFMDKLGEYTDFRKFFGIKMSPGSSVNTTAAYSDTTTLKVDEDGDGETDYIYRAGKNENGAKTEVTLDWRLLVAIISGGISLIALGVMITSILLSKKQKQNIA